MSDAAVRGRWPLLLWTLLLSVLVVIVCSVATDPVYRDRIRHVFTRPEAGPSAGGDLEALERADTQLPVQLPSSAPYSAIRSAGRSVPGRLVVSVGGCDECIRFPFAEWLRETTPRHIPLIVVGRGASDAARLRRKLPRGCTVVSDPRGDLHKWLNGYWSGRLYLFDRNWRMVWRSRGIGHPYSVSEASDLTALMDRVALP